MEWMIGFFTSSFIHHQSSIFSSPTHYNPFAMKLYVNGEERELPTVRTVQDLVKAMGITGKAIAVEVNRKVVRKKDHESTELREGDSVEIVTLVGGG